MRDGNKEFWDGRRFKLIKRKLSRKREKRSMEDREGG